MPKYSDLIFAYGSGTNIAAEFHSKWQASDVLRTSRAVFSAFCDAIGSGRDDASAGPPQLVGIYLRGFARSFGVIHDNSFYLNGMRIEEGKTANIEWRNSLFERCDSDGKPNGQRHARPKKLDWK